MSRRIGQPTGRRLSSSAPFASRIAIAIVAIAFSGPIARANGIGDTLLAYAVHVRQTPTPGWGAGAGIYLGRGVFITAAHVAGRSWWSNPKVVISGQAYPTVAIKEGSFEGTDLTLLGVNEALLPLRLRLRRIRLCPAPPVPGQAVVTVTPGVVAAARVLAPETLPAEVRRFRTVINEVEKTGNSGSGVFDARLGCLAGIMSRKISTRVRSVNGSDSGQLRDVAKYFVPASEIKAFLPPDQPF